MSTWPGLEVLTLLWGILSTWLPSGKLTRGPEEAWPSRAPPLPLLQQHQFGGDRVACQLVLI